MMIIIIFYWIIIYSKLTKLVIEGESCKSNLFYDLLDKMEFFCLENNRFNFKNQKSNIISIIYNNKIGKRKTILIMICPKQ